MSDTCQILRILGRWTHNDAGRARRRVSERGKSYGRTGVELSFGAYQRVASSTRRRHRRLMTGMGKNRRGCTKARLGSFDVITGDRERDHVSATAFTAQPQPRILVSNRNLRLISR